MTVIVEKAEAPALRSPNTWTEFMKEYRGTSLVEAKIALLGKGFKIKRFEAREYDSTYSERGLRTYRRDLDRVVFYLEEANGYTEYRIGVENQRLVAEKAFEQLCENVFAYSDFWHEFRAEAMFLNAVFRLFETTVDEHGNLHMKNWPFGKDTPTHVIARKFLADLISFILLDGYKGKDFLYDRDLSLEENLKKVVYTLKVIDYLHILCDSNKFQRASLAIPLLESMAMKERLQFPNCPMTGVPQERSTRLPKTLEEAVYAGSKAAEVCLILKTRKSVSDRFLLEERKQIQAALKEQREKEAANTVFVS